MELSVQDGCLRLVRALKGTGRQDAGCLSREGPWGALGRLRFPAFGILASPVVSC